MRRYHEYRVVIWLLYGGYIIVIYLLYICSIFCPEVQPRSRIFSALALRCMRAATHAVSVGRLKQPQPKKIYVEDVLGKATPYWKKIKLQTDINRMHLIRFANTSWMNCHESSSSAGPAQAKRAWQFIHLRKHTSNCANARRFKNLRTHCIRVSCEAERLHCCMAARIVQVTHPPCDP